MMITVPGLAGLALSGTGAGAAQVSALPIRSTGPRAIPGHTYYIFAGGRAFAFPSPQVSDDRSPTGEDGFTQDEGTGRAPAT